MLTLITKHREKGTVTRIRNTERAVKRNAVNPSSFESSEKEKSVDSKNEFRGNWRKVSSMKGKPSVEGLLIAYHTK